MSKNGTLLFQHYIMVLLLTAVKLPTLMRTVKLTPSIKHLLSLRRPNPPPGPSLSQLNKVFTETFRDAQAKKAETGWLVAAVSSFIISILQRES